MSDVSRGHEYMPVKTRMLWAGMFSAAAIAVGAWALWPKEQQAARSHAVSERFEAPAELPPIVLRTPVSAPVAPPPPPADVARKPAPAPATSPQKAAFGSWADEQAINSRMEAGAERARIARELVAQRRQEASNDPNVARPGQSEYAQRMQVTQFANIRPKPPNLPPSFTIRKGTVFPCTVDQPISSDLPGPVRCTVDYPGVRSMDGYTMLLPPGTQVNGVIEKGLSVGEQRLFLVWTDALTPGPDYKAIPLDAPGADQLGQVGAPGDIDTHLWQRAKAALLLSLVDIAANAASSAGSSGRGNTILNLGPISSNASSLGQMAFQHDNNIPPTLWRGPGYPMSVYVNKYIDLSEYYDLSLRRP